MPDFTRCYFPILDALLEAKWTYDSRHQRYWARLGQFEVEIKESNDGFEGCVVVDGQVVLESAWDKRLADAKSLLAEAICLRPREMFLPIGEPEQYPSERVS